MVELSRVCEVYAEHDSLNGRTRCGSGYLVAGRLVLTAGHAVGPIGSPVQVRCAGVGDKPLDGRVAWSQYGGETDEALLEITDPRWIAPADLPPVRWGRLVTSAAGIGCEVAGFPAAQLRRSGATVVMRDLAHVTGSINPLDGAKWGILQISVTSAAPDPAGSGDSLWGGLSGAGVLCGPLLTGVITADADKYGGRRLNAVPVGRLLAATGFRALLAQALGEVPVAEPVELEPFSSDPVRPNTPAALLRADVEAVGFRGREGLLADLAAWCMAPGSYSVRLLTGPGGQGKTRMARELGRRMTADGWAVLHLAPAPADGVVDYGVLGALRRAVPTLVIIDYAEARTGQVGEVVSQLAKGHGQARVLLLSRTAGEWQRELSAASAALDVAAPGYPVEVPLPPLADGAVERAAVFADALTDLSARLGALPGQDGVDWAQARDRVAVPDLSSPRYGTVLAVQMSALAALLSGGHGEGGPVGRPEDVLLAHEEGYWSRLAERRQLKPADPTRMHRWLVAATSLCTAADEDEAVAMIARLPGLGDPSSAGVRLAAARWLHDLFPERNLFCGSLQPDVLAEHLVGSVLADRPTVFDAVLADATADQAHHGLTVLARAAVGRPQVVEAAARVITSWPAALAPVAARVASETENPAPLLSALDDVLASEGIEADLLEALDAGMPAHSEIHRDRAERVTARLVQLRRQRDRAQRRRQPLRYALRPQRGTPDSADLARALYSHAFNLAEVGRAAESMAAYRESVAILRQLAKTDPDAGGMLARAVNDMTVALVALGRHREALAASDEAMATLSGTSQVDAETRDYLVATAGMNRGKSLMDLGRMEEALAATENAIALLRTLPSDWTGRQILGLSAMNMAAILGQLGRSKEAVVAAHEAVGIFRDLAGSLPDQFTGNLAMTLINTSRVELDAGAVSTALVAAAEAVTILRRLSAGHPEVFASLLGMALVNQGAISMTAQPGNGRAILEEAVRLYRGLAADQPNVHEGQLVMALVDLSGTEMYLNENERAQELAGEAVAIAQPLAEENPEAFGPLLVMAIDGLAAALGASGQAAAAVAGAREAVSVWRRLADQRPTAFEPRLAGALARLAGVMVSPEQAEEAHDVAMEAVALCRRIAPSPDWAILGLSLGSLSKALSGLGRHEEALAASNEAVRIFRAQTGANPGAFSAELAHALSFMNSDLVKLKRLAEGIQVGAESIALFQALAAEQPAAYAEDLTNELYGAVSQLGTLGRTEVALERARELVEFSRLMAADGAAEDRANLARALRTLSFRLSRAGRQAQARAAQLEGAALYRDLTEADPGRYRPRLATALTQLAEAEAEVGDFAAAAAALTEAVPLLEELARSAPGEHRSALIDALVPLGAYLSELGRNESALGAATRARALLDGDAADGGAEADQDSHRLALAEAMQIAVVALVGLNRPDEALASADELIELLRDGDPGDAATGATLLAGALRLRGLALAALDRTEEAIITAAEAVSALRALAEADSGDQQATAALAIALQNQGKFLSDGQWYGDALAVTGEALALLRKVSGDGPSQLSAYIAMCQLNLSGLHAQLEQWESAIGYADQAVTSYRALAGPDLDGYLAELAAAKRNLAVACAAADRRPQAIAAFREAIDLYERLDSEAGDDDFAGRLADARERLDKALDAFG